MAPGLIKSKHSVWFAVRYRLSTGIQRSRQAGCRARHGGQGWKHCWNRRECRVQACMCREAQLQVAEPGSSCAAAHTSQCPGSARVMRVVEGPEELGGWSSAETVCLPRRCNGRTKHLAELLLPACLPACLQCSHALCPACHAICSMGARCRPASWLVRRLLRGGAATQATQRQKRAGELAGGHSSPSSSSSSSSSSS